MAEPTPESIRDRIAMALECSELSVEGDGRHFQATIVSPRFAGLPRLARHRLVYAALGDAMRAEIHALSMSTLAPGESG